MFKPPLFPRIETQRDVPQLFVWISLFVIICTAYWIRLQFWAIAGGFAPDYIGWAKVHYMGGITPFYTYYANKIMQGSLREIFGLYPPGYPSLIALIQSLGVADLQSFRLVQIGIDAAACLLAYGV